MIVCHYIACDHAPIVLAFHPNKEFVRAVTREMNPDLPFLSSTLTVMFAGVPGQMVSPVGEVGSCDLNLVNSQ